MNPAPIELGSILFTLVEPHPGHEVAYNRWYERDHFYSGCMIGPGILAGRRFVATADLKKRRFPDNSPIASDQLTGSYLALYWIERSMQDEWGTWAAKQVHALHKAGRMFERRDHIHTKMYRYRFGVSRDDDGVPPELALDHPFAGLAALFFDAKENTSRDDALAWLRDEYLPGITHDSAAAMHLGFTPVPIPDDAPADVPRLVEDERRILVLAFLDDPPEESWDRDFVLKGETLGTEGRVKLLWASPFVPTIPGTDVYTDRLR